MVLWINRSPVWRAQGAIGYDADTFGVAVLDQPVQDEVWVAVSLVVLWLMFQCTFVQEPFNLVVEVGDTKDFI